MACSFYGHRVKYTAQNTKTSYLLLVLYLTKVIYIHLLGKSRKDLAEISVTIGHFTVIDGSEVDGGLVLIQTFLLYYVYEVILALTGMFQGQFP